MSLRRESNLRSLFGAVDSVGVGWTASHFAQIFSGSDTDPMLP